MNDKFNEQKDTLVSIKKEISLLHQQIDYLLRNEKPLELLDLDVMMNRTHTVYDLMCGIDLGDPVDMDDSVAPEMIESLFGIEEKAPAEEEPAQEAPEPVVIEEPEPVVVEEPEPVVVEEPVEEEPVKEEKNDDLGFILNFEPASATEENPDVFTTGDEIEMTIPHVDPPQEEVAPQEEVVPQEEEEEIPYEPVIFGNIEEKDDTSFELDTPETLGDKLQHIKINDLRSAIGINDKFLLVNELFGGSMEKYNRSIENLNDLKTLNGALIYMNELRIELQWNSNNEAYKKLLELVHRKYEA